MKCPKCGKELRPEDISITFIGKDRELYVIFGVDIEAYLREIDQIMELDHQELECLYSWKVDMKAEKLLQEINASGFNSKCTEKTVKAEWKK